MKLCSLSARRFGYLSIVSSSVCEFILIHRRILSIYTFFPLLFKRSLEASNENATLYIICIRLFPFVSRRKFRYRARGEAASTVRARCRVAQNPSRAPPATASPRFYRNNPRRQRRPRGSRWDRTRIIASRARALTAATHGRRCVAWFVSGWSVTPRSRVIPWCIAAARVWWHSYARAGRREGEKR